ncbi:hypothetical protein X961_5229 [Burkholderia pseudomallei MSHR5613]|uniref:Uncharacterized protein n=1 Tax=Burkholderia pseudomallei (strain 1106a) TaxID=357348 RepID=A3P9A6_BURP0|nr:hypothetical protein BURPS668_A3003 [Burkholderia pseudomallei 668]ABN93520.1 hypothetical protein BURPS1106A_A2887 [Burkholderia pseudomallei 1106a]AFR20768.1 hypothetical protein BPC006_II2845 [Burkholderia pseudomallei BPC006]EBA46950.1 hypothetical protein BURPS305_2316 [Burkholderia pseudomallei 305]EDO89060.1 hypothetical protein BURPSPAST_AC0048 [Burkholderia pseudomallei Pasteur 52237]EDP88237.1 hypothetical protein BMA10399_K0225 [Burkholderia mallei ATCC 10399]EEP49802.1 conserve
MNQFRINRTFFALLSYPASDAQKPFLALHAKRRFRAPLSTDCLIVSKSPPQMPRAF